MYVRACAQMGVYMGDIGWQMMGVISAKWRNGATQALGLGDTLEFSKLEGATQDILTCNVEEVRSFKSSRYPAHTPFPHASSFPVSLRAPTVCIGYVGNT